MVVFTQIFGLLMYELVLTSTELIKTTVLLLCMITVIFNAYYVTKSSISKRKIMVLKIIRKILTFPDKLTSTPQNKLAKQRLKIAIALLENNSIETILMAINDLEQIAVDHPEYHWVIMEVLTSFVRNNALLPSQEQVSSEPSAKNRAEIQAAVTVIARRDTNKDPKNEQIDLSHTNMQGLNLNGANLKQINLYQANLSGANLAGANLEGAILSAANLSGANLNLVNFSGAILSAANLSGANLSGANLHRANLYLARLHGAILNDSILNEANLREAKFSS
ncbi:putative low-complexity protein [Cylindrospermum stagnale PCC 7417]|uniref:Putative low-complexity protein n=1 Tax=Cylindrospermum stagnale PCC 7417 TaxID=56107 RepID=K9X6X6_9NOST|nr:pentapeptide repeat-containing protein [Cylindrospermum stagnale]AFZ27854.1 putative low-complexity protein [Cylindrospermum stagnale PCC 7417]